MARYLKNPDITRSGKLAARLPMVPNNSYGDAPVDGLIRFNQDTSRIEFYYNNNWSEVAKIGTVNIVIDPFITGDTSSNPSGDYHDMSYSYIAGQENSVLVFVGGVQQIPVTNYNFSSGVASKHIYITPSTSGDAGQAILVIHNINSTNVPA